MKFRSQLCKQYLCDAITKSRANTFAQFDNCVITMCAKYKLLFAQKCANCCAPVVLHKNHLTITLRVCSVCAIFDQTFVHCTHRVVLALALLVHFFPHAFQHFEWRHQSMQSIVVFTRFDRRLGLAGRISNSSALASDFVAIAGVCYGYRMLNKYQKYQMIQLKNQRNPNKTMANRNSGLEHTCGNAHRMFSFGFGLL